MKKNNTRKLAQSATIAAIYVALTYIANMLGLSSGAIQIRFSEALCILPVFTVSAVWGLLLGCLLANILTGSILIDIIFGSLATLIGAILTRRFKDNFTLAVASPIMSNTFIIPFVLKFAYGFEGSIFFFALTIFIGEFLSCGVLGYPLFKALSKRRSLFN